VIHGFSAKEGKGMVYASQAAEIPTTPSAALLLGRCLVE